MNLTVMQDGSERVSYEEPAIPLYVRRGDLKQFSGMAALCHWHDDVELLRSTSLPVTEIAAACGFSGSSYFAERFSQAKGCSPTQYRRK